jgi:hypothetical protein
MNKQDETARFEAAVQAEVARRMAEQQAQFAQMMEQTMRASLQGMDGANAALEKERQALAQALDAAKAERRKAEAEGEKIAEDYFQKSRVALVESAQHSQLRNLAHDHLLAGRSVEDICQWLRVEAPFVEAIIEVIDRRAAFRAEQKRPPAQPPGYRLTYQDYGRSGTIWFEDGQFRFDMWWEFGGINALVIIDIPTPDQWTARTQMPIERRDEVLRYVAEQVIHDQTLSGNNGYTIGTSAITIYR